MIRFTGAVLPLTFLALALAGCDDPDAPETDAPEDDDRKQTVFEVDVAEDMTRFLFDDAPLHEDGMPDGGNSFVTSGYLYPAGFLDTNEGVNADGSPAHPDKVIGTWTCRGFFLGEGAYEEGIALNTVQTYMLYDAPGYAADKLDANFIITQGFELMVPDIQVTRPITGTSGSMSGMFGEMDQVLEGFSAGGGVELSVVFDLIER